MISSIENDIEIGNSEKLAVGTGELKKINRGAGEKGTLFLVFEIKGYPAFPDRFEQLGYFRFVENLFHGLACSRLLHHEIGKINGFHLAGFQK